MPASSGWRRPTRSVHLRETGAGLDAALAGVDTVIDVTSVDSISAARSVEFFTAASASLLSAEARQRVGHHVALSIVGIDAVPFGYYAGKLAQERMVTDAVVPHSILRATQFHEFAGQLLSQTTLGPLSVVPTGLVRPVAASEVAVRDQSVSIIWIRRPCRSSPNSRSV